MALRSTNPGTDEVLQEYTEASPEAVAGALETAHRAFVEWKQTPFAMRGEALRAVAGRLRRQRDELSRLMALEMGKPLAQGRAEVDKCAWVCEHYAEAAEGLLAPEPVATDARRSLVVFEPLGVVLAVMPWNFPLWQVFRFAAPALMAGNAAVLKHASNVSGCALAIAEVWEASGVPPGLFATLLVGAERVGAIIDAPAVRAVTLTGSTEAGRSVAALAGRALKKTVLELGGSDPYVVLEDADVEKAAEICAASRLINGGQSCIAAKRFIVVGAVRAGFEDAFVERMRKPRVGNPLDESSDLGPLARRDLRDQVHHQVETSLWRGARRLLGGEVPDGPGAFYPPTVLTDVRRGMPAFDEETFGPVAAIVPVADEADAIRAANDSPFGLGAAIFTGDPERGERLAGTIESGNVFVNAAVKSDPRLPFGGVKQSGYGRELGSFGIREFVNVKTIYVA